MSEPRGIPAGLEPKLTKAISEFFARTYDGESEADVIIDIIADAILADRAELDRLRETTDCLVNVLKNSRQWVLSFPVVVDHERQAMLKEIDAVIAKAEGRS